MFVLQPRLDLHDRRSLMPRQRSRLLAFGFPFAAWLALALAVWPLADGRAQTSFRQVDLTEKQVQGFIAAQKPMTDATDKLQSEPSEKPDPKLQAALEAIAKQLGFKDLAEYDDVAATISMVMAGIDPDTKQFTQADEAVRQQIKDIEADKSLPADERKQALDELNESLKSAQPIRNPANIDLVKKYYDKIEAAME
jgi:hypothetical protein